MSVKSAFSESLHCSILTSVQISHLSEVHERKKKKIKYLNAKIRLLTNHIKIFETVLEIMDFQLTLFK